MKKNSENDHHSLFKADALWDLPNEALGDQLRNIMSSVNLTQVEASELMKVTKSTIQRWVAGEVRPPYSAVVMILNLAKHLGPSPKKR